MPDSPGESQKHNLSKFRPPRLAEPRILKPVRLTPSRGNRPSHRKRLRENWRQPNVPPPPHLSVAFRPLPSLRRLGVFCLDQRPPADNLGERYEHDDKRDRRPVRRFHRLARLADVENW